MKKLLVFIAFLATSGFALSQCPMCKTALSSNRGQKSLSKPVVGNGINKGILFLLATPYVLVGTAGAVYFNYRRKQRLNGKL
jgi:hypothetical protein